jgi:5-bromo-4-chloroindolyl phosphate hydrolysis protein
MNIMLWVTPNSDYFDEAEEFLFQQHDNMVKQRYRVMKEQAEIRKPELTFNKSDLAIASTKRVAEILDDDSFYENYMDLFYP